MSKTLKITLTTVLVVILLFFSSLVLTNILIKNKVEKFLLTRLPSHITQHHKGISLHTLGGTITINDLVVQIANKKDTVVHTKIKLEKLIVQNVSYWDYLVNSEIHIETIKIKSTDLFYYSQNVHKTIDSTHSSGPLKLYKPVVLDDLQIDSANLYIYDNTVDSLTLYVENSTVNISNIKVDKEIIKRRLPVEFERYSVNADSVFVKANAYENVTVSDVSIIDNRAVLNNLSLKTKLSKTALSHKIKTERDHFDLKVNSIHVDGIDFGFDTRKLFVSSAFIKIETPELNIFRDKLVADDMSIKYLYSQSLRELPFELTVDSIKIENGAIKYTEKVKANNQGGSITLGGLSANLFNVSNTYKSPKQTKIDVSGFFMETTPFESEWYFDVNNTNDDFIFKMAIGRLQAERLNRFTEPNLKVRLSGQTNKIYYTIDGDNRHSKTDLRVNYEDFEIAVLNKYGNKKKWLLSTVANLFVSKNSDDKSDDFREAAVEVERDKTKSVFNYIWLNLSKGLLESITGNGEK